jgi:hypothetical protein
MKASAAVALLALAVLPALTAGQSVPSVGNRVRVQRTDGVAVVGMVSAITPEEIRLIGDGGDALAVPTGQIESLERSLGVRRSFAKNLFVTMGVSAGALGLISAAAWTPCTDTGFLACMMHPESRGDAFGWGFMGGAVIGLPIGVIIGLASKGERWDPLQPPTVGSVALSVVARPGSGLALRGSIPVGGS